MERIEVNNVGRPQVLIQEKPMILEPRCLQESIGSCLGCNILEIADQVRRRRGINTPGVRKAILNIQQEHCPSGNKLILPVIENQSLW